MKIFGHEFGRKTEASTKDAPVAPAEGTEVAAPAAVEQGVALANPDAAAMGAEANKLAALIDTEVATTGNLDTPVAPTETPVSDEVVSAEIAALPETEEPVAASTETFRVPESATQEVVPAPEVAPQSEVPAAMTSQEVGPSPVEAPVTIDPIADATAAPESGDLWEKFDAANTTAVDASTPVEAVPTVETPEQNQ